MPARAESSPRSWRKSFSVLREHGSRVVLAYAKRVTSCGRMGNGRRAKRLHTRAVINNALMTRSPCADCIPRTWYKIVDANVGRCWDSGEGHHAAQPRCTKTDGETAEASLLRLRPLHSIKSAGPVGPKLNCSEDTQHNAEVVVEETTRNTAVLSTTMCQ